MKNRATHLRGKTAVVTGAAGGIGEALCMKLAGEYGMNLIITPMIAMVRPDLMPKGMILPEDIANIAGFYLENRLSNAVIDEIDVHRVTKEPFA